jgi:hypothetical protein
MIMGTLWRVEGLGKQTQSKWRLASCHFETSATGFQTFPTSCLSSYSLALGDLVVAVVVCPGSHTDEQKESLWREASSLVGARASGKLGEKLLGIWRLHWRCG